MKELTGDLWDFHAQGHYICITTNGTVRRDGACVMDRGIAKQAALKFPSLPFTLGGKIRESGNCVYIFQDQRLFTLPVKFHWHEQADIGLIMCSTSELADRATYFGIDQVYLPRPGCGNGHLQWSDVRPMIAPILDDRFTVVEIHP